MKEENNIKEIMDILHDVNKSRDKKYFEKVMDKLLDSDKKTISNYLIVLKDLLK